MQRDFDAELRVEKIEVNPFVLSLRVTGLELDNPVGEPTARLGELFGNFQLSSLFRLALTFDEIRLSAPELFVARDRDGAMDFAYLLPAATDNASEATTGDEPEASLLQALIYNFSIEGAFINWTDEVPVDPVKARFGPINIGINELNTLPDRSGRQTVVIATENSGTLSWTGDLQLNPLRSSGKATLEDSRFPLISAYIRHQTGLDITDGTAELELDYSVDTTASGELEASVVNIDLTFSEVVLQSFADGTGFDFAGEDQRILTLPRIRLADGALHWPAQTVSLGSISIEDPRIELSRDANGVFNVEPRQTGGASQTESAATEPAPDSAENEWQVTVGNLAINGLSLNLVDQTLTPAATLGVTDFNLEISDISNLAGKRFPTRLSLQALSGGSVTLAGDFALLPQPLFDLEVSADAVQLAGLQPYIAQQANLSLDSGAVNLKGRASNSAEEPLLFNGDLEIVDLAIAESLNNAQFTSWKQFRAEKIALSLAKQRLDISRLRFEQLYGDILINEDGSLNIEKIDKTRSDRAATEPAEEPAETTSTEAGPAFNLRIGDIVLVDASANFSDRSLPLPFAVKIEALNGKMTTISTTSSEPSEVNFEGKVDEFGFARINGIVTPLQPTSNTDLLVSFENIDVPSFTPYSIPFAGREVASGRLDLKLGYAVKDSQLVGENSVVLRDFELGAEVPHPDALDLPLGLAVALLKDANGKIAIDLPVRGDVGDPDFNYGSVIMSALGNLLTKIVLSPFTALGSLLGIEASELENIKFLDGRSDLSPPEMEKTGKLAEALALRPELQLSIAGVSDPVADSLALRTAALDRMLEQRIAEVGASSDPSTQYADLRRIALEQLFEEENAEQAEALLQNLRQQFTSLVEVEDQADPVPTLDKLAYANALRAGLIDSQVIGDTDLATLASARAETLKSALLAIDEALQERVVITESIAVTREPDQAIMMKVTLGSTAD